MEERKPLIPVKELAKRYALFIISLFISALGVAITKKGELGVSPISSVANVVMNSGEAFVKAVSDTVHKEFGSVKVVFDISCVIVAVVLSLIFFDFHVMGAREGTIIAADSSSSSGTSSCGSRSRSSSLSESLRCGWIIPNQFGVLNSSSPRGCFLCSKLPRSTADIFGSYSPACSEPHSLCRAESPDSVTISE